jgi:hypothetical protein
MISGTFVTVIAEHANIFHLISQSTQESSVPQASNDIDIHSAQFSSIELNSKSKSKSNNKATTKTKQNKTTAKAKAKAKVKAPVIV